MLISMVYFAYKATRSRGSCSRNTDISKRFAQPSARALGPGVIPVPLVRTCAPFTIRSKTEALFHPNRRALLAMIAGTKPWHAYPTFLPRHTQILYLPRLWMCFHPSGVALIVPFFSFEYLCFLGLAPLANLDLMFVVRLISLSR